MIGLNSEMSKESNIFAIAAIDTLEQLCFILFNAVLWSTLSASIASIPPDMNLIVKQSRLGFVNISSASQNMLFPSPQRPCFLTQEVWESVTGERQQLRETFVRSCIPEDTFLRCVTSVRHRYRNAASIIFRNSVTNASLAVQRKQVQDTVSSLVQHCVSPPRLSDV